MISTLRENQRDAPYPKIPDSLKYFCISESTAYYLQKYVQYRKRKIFYGKQNFADLMEVIRKHRTEKFLVPSSDIHKQTTNFHFHLYDRHVVVLSLCLYCGTCYLRGHLKCFPSNDWGHHRILWHATINSAYSTGHFLRSYR